MHSKERKALHLLNFVSLYGEGGEHGLSGFPEIHSKFLCLGCVEIKVIVETPVSQLLDLLPVGRLVCDQACNGGVISKIDNGVGGMDGGAIMSEEGVEERALRGEERRLCNEWPL